MQLWTTLKAYIAASTSLRTSRLTNVNITTIDAERIYKVEALRLKTRNISQHLLLKRVTRKKEASGTVSHSDSA